MQAEAVEGSHSLHVTISASQHHSWADLLHVALPQALDLAAERHLSLRRNLPHDMLAHLGVAK